MISKVETYLGDCLEIMPTLLDKRILPKLNKELCELEKLHYSREDTLTEDLIFNVR